MPRADEKDKKEGAYQHDLHLQRVLHEARPRPHGADQAFGGQDRSVGRRVPAREHDDHVQEGDGVEEEHRGRTRHRDNETS